MLGARFSLLLLSLGIWGLSAAAAPLPKLTPEKREELRYHLESLFDEADLAIRNQKADRSDLARLERDFKELKIYERIPLARKIESLKMQLVESSGKYGLKLAAIDTQISGKAPAPVPVELYTDGPRFQLTPDQVVETIELRLVIQGKRNWIESWISHLPDDQLRMVMFKGLESRGPRQWVARAEAFRYREVEYPRILLRDPIHLLPKWARAHPKEFAQAEPKLWRYVTRTRELEPRARPLFEVRRRFLLDDARISFFISLSKKPVS